MAIDEDDACIRACAPLIILMRVDLPAPFSPTSSVHFTGHDRPIDIPQCMNTAIALIDAVHLEDGITARLRGL